MVNVNVNEILWCDLLNKTPLAVLPFGTIYLVCILTQSVDEILWCDHSNETSSAVVSHVTIYLVCSSNL